MYENKTYYALLKEAQSKVSDDVQKGEGSLIYNALSALAYEMEKLYIQADFILKQSCAATADFEHLKLRASDRGIYPYEATKVEVKAEFNVSVSIGARFNYKAYNYTVIEEIEPKIYILQCEEAGSGPNGLIGELMPITFVEGLESAVITEMLVPGRDNETYDSLYKRYLESFQSGSFGGNITAYKTHVNALSGVGGCKVFPVWDGVGTVKIVVIGSDWRKISDYQVQEIQENVCPAPGMGYGFAPIDHDVTIVSVEEIKIDIETSITFGNGYSWAVSHEKINEAIDNHFDALRRTWGDGNEEDTLTVYIARLESAILDVPGIIDIQKTTLNGQANNLVLGSVQIPVLQEVINV